MKIVIIFIFIIIPFLYVLVKDKEIIKNGIKSNPKSILWELLFFLGVLTMIAAFISNNYIFSKIVAVFLLLLSSRRLLSVWKTNKVRVIYTLSLFILYFSLPYLLN